MTKLKNNLDELFCQKYVMCYNAKIAYHEVHPDVVKNSAYSLGWRMLQRDDIKARITELKNEISKEAQLENVDILNRLKNYLDADLTEFMELTPDEVKKLPVELRTMVTKFETTERGSGENVTKTIKLEFFDKKTAMEMINKHVGFYEKDNKQKIEDKPTIIVPDQETSEKYMELLNRLK
jgi:phage terminase small subunit